MGMTIVTYTVHVYRCIYIHIHIVITKTIAVNQQMETTTTGGDVWYVYRLEL